MKIQFALCYLISVCFVLFDFFLTSLYSPLKLTEAQDGYLTHFFQMSDRSQLLLTTKTEHSALLQALLRSTVTYLFSEDSLLLDILYIPITLLLNKIQISPEGNLKDSLIHLLSRLLSTRHAICECLQQLQT